jgi:hypothetical protein
MSAVTFESPRNVFIGDKRPLAPHGRASVHLQLCEYDVLCASCPGQQDYRLIASVASDFLTSSVRAGWAIPTLLVRMTTHCRHPVPQRPRHIPSLAD